jgi:hypothetical protein
MWENRISSYFDAGSGPASHPFPAAAQEVVPGSFPAFPHVVQAADLYQAARARAQLDHELDKLFNPDAAVE